jgi:hypothetical protein
VGAKEGAIIAKPLSRRQAMRRGVIVIAGEGRVREKSWPARSIKSKLWNEHNLRFIKTCV